MEPSAGSGIASLKAHLSGLRSSVEWLSSRGLPASRLAFLFGTTANHIRQLVYRARHTPFRLFAPRADLNALLAQGIDRLRPRLGVRPNEDDVVLPSARLSRIDELEHRVDDIARTAPTFADGVCQLKQLLPYVGYPGEVHWLRLAARIHQQMAWFLGHKGFSTAAFGEAKISINLSRVAFAEWNDPVDLRRLTEACLIASNACLLIGDAENACKYLQIAKDASGAIGDTCGSEHFRQLGVAYYQLQEDDLARQCFERAPQAMDAKSEAENAAHPLMVGQRHLAHLGRGNWEWAGEILSVVKRDYPAGSLQYTMMINSAAACGLLTDSRQIEVSAMELLEGNWDLARLFHHQWTRAALLSLTPELPTELRRPWIRRALYENAFKDF